MHKIVLTGATSSIGIAIINKCIRDETEVLAIANPGSVNIKRIPESPYVTVAEASLEQLSSPIFDEYGGRFKDGAFIHLAWAATNGDAARNLVTPQALNIKYALDALDLAEKLGCSVFLGAGSQAEYGRREGILTEELIERPETAYGMAKLSACHMTRLAAAQKGIKHIWPRILSAYGPNCPDRTVINYSLIELINERIPELTKCEQIWDFIYIDDVAKALLLLCSKGRDGEVYLVGSGEDAVLRDYLTVSRDLLSERLGKELKPLGFGVKPYGPNTVMHLACSIDKLKADTGYEPDYTFADGMKETVEWMLNRTV